jgi:hypothetical protein
MFAFLNRDKKQASLPELTAPHPGDLVYRSGTTMPIPDWQLQAWPDTNDVSLQHCHANGLAAAWLDALSVALGSQYRRIESTNFMLFSRLEQRPTQVLTDYLEKSLRRVLGALPGITESAGFGKYVVLVFADEETYYSYVSHYANDGEQANDTAEGFSSGMFIHHGYGHFVFVQGSFDAMEPVVVHELTHCTVQHLPLPAWLNEGLAVNTEQRFVPTRPRYSTSEFAYLMGKFWNAQTIQEFWSGKSFLRSDEGQSLSYELARLMVQMLAKDYDLFKRYCNLAKTEDAGQDAARQLFGHGLETIVTAVLGTGVWLPDPNRWSAGVERGQF